MLGSFFLLTSTFFPSSQADDAATNAVVEPAPPPGPVDPNVVSHQGYNASRYESLWKQSPFAVETPEDSTNATENADYALVGVAELDGVTYASLVEKQNQNHLLISSSNPINGLALKSIAKKPNGESFDTFATFTRDGQPLTLKLEGAAAAGGLQGGAPAAVPNMPAAASPGFVTPNIPMPGTGQGAPVRPMIRIHRPIIHVPSRIDVSQPPGAPAAGQPPPPPPSN